MLKNFLRTSFRSLQKNKLSSAINIVGLGLAVGCCMVSYSFLDWATHQDDYHTKKDQLYVVERISEERGDDFYSGTSPLLLGPTLMADYPQVKNMSRMDFRGSGVVFKKGDNVFREQVAFADPSFFEMFDFETVWGSVAEFENNNNSIVLTKALSERIFGTDNSVGENVSIHFTDESGEQIENFQVIAVMIDAPVQSSFYFNCIIPFEKQSAIGLGLKKGWDQLVNMTFLEVENDADMAIINSGQQKIVDIVNAANINDPITSFHFQPLRSMNTHAYMVDNSHFKSSHIAAYIMLGGIAIVILLMVCFNYMNISIASATTRFKEMSVRKVLGSSKKQIIYQFLAESFIICFLGILLGIILGYTIFVPWFSEMAQMGNELTNYVMSHSRMYIMLAVLLIVLVIGGSAYPAFYVSGLNPLAIFQKKGGLSQKNGFRKSLIGLQLMFTMLAISIAIAVKMEGTKMLEKSWGYDPSNIVVVHIDGKPDYALLKSNLEKDPGIAQISGSDEGLGWYQKQLTISAEGEEQNVQNLNVIPGFISKMGIEVLEGRDLKEESEADRGVNILVNQKFSKMMAWESAVGKTISFNDKKYTIVGEVANFNYEDFELAVEPLVIKGVTNESANYMYVNLADNELNESIHAPVEAIWKQTYPNIPFEYHYQDQVFQGYFNGFEQVGAIMGGVCLVAIILSIMGLFGLTFLILGKKMKEISVKKVLGAGNFAIIYLLNKEFVYALGIAAIVGLPLGYWLSNQIVHILNPLGNASILAFASTFIITAIMIVVSISYHLYKALTSNPVEFLRDE